MVLHFDPDSSPEAWEHYKKCYNNEFWSEKYNFSQPVFFEYIDKAKYVDFPLKLYNRLLVLKEGIEVINDESKLTYYSPVLRLGGETDFNFNEKNMIILFEFYFKIIIKTKKIFIKI